MSREEQSLTALSAPRLLVYARIRQLVADGAQCRCEEEAETTDAGPATEEAAPDQIAVTAVTVVAPPVLFQFGPDDWGYSVRPDSGVAEIAWRWPRAYHEMLADPDALFFGEAGTRAIEGISFIVDEVDCPYLALPDEGEWGNLSAVGCLYAEFTRIEETGEASARIRGLGCPAYRYEDFEAGGIRALPYTYSARLRVKWWLYDISDWFPFSYTCTKGEPPPPPPPGEGFQPFPQ